MTFLGQKQIKLFLCLATLSGLLSMPACQPPLTMLEQIQQAGELKVITRVGPTTYFKNEAESTGFEFELAKLFAQHLGVALKVQVSEQISDIIDQVQSNHAHLAAAGLTITRDRNLALRFTSPYQQITQTLVYRQGTEKPERLSDLTGKVVLVMANSSHEERLRVLKQSHPNLNWVALPVTTSEVLLRKVFEKEADFAIVDSNEFDAHRPLMPELREAFNVGQPDSLAWALNINGDPSLYRAAETFLSQASADGTLEDLKERYYGHMTHFDYVGARRFLKHMEKRLPKHLDDFQLTAIKVDLDWRLLAAIGYQESHWQPDAKSPTGVRGLMMLTRRTAKEMGIANRLNPTQSIDGGARYLKKLLQRLPEEIPQHDRVWMALAAYNAGYGHVMDARKITELEGDNPNDWFEVKKRLPLLQKKEYYKYTRYGYARSGSQAPIYVENIRRYYDSLLWATESQQMFSLVDSIQIKQRATL